MYTLNNLVTLEDGVSMWELSAKELGCNSYNLMEFDKYYVNLDSKWVTVAVVTKIFICLFSYLLCSNENNLIYFLQKEH